ncbi:MAG: hypothetical protein LBV07_06755 [Syntrophobacterales bacterium]|jgi:hypothetical protein|nr:hypothetical protein [Syntrophobacterales bacterium]
MARFVIKIEIRRVLSVLTSCGILVLREVFFAKNTGSNLRNTIAGAARFPPKSTASKLLPARKKKLDFFPPIFVIDSTPMVHRCGY